MVGTAAEIGAAVVVGLTVIDIVEVKVAAAGATVAKAAAAVVTAATAATGTVVVAMAAPPAFTSSALPLCPVHSRFFSCFSSSARSLISSRSLLWHASSATLTRTSSANLARSLCSNASSASCALTSARAVSTSARTMSRALRSFARASPPSPFSASARRRRERLRSAVQRKSVPSSVDLAASAAPTRPSRCSVSAVQSWFHTMRRVIRTQAAARRRTFTTRIGERPLTIEAMKAMKSCECATRLL